MALMDSSGIISIIGENEPHAHHIKTHLHTMKVQHLSHQSVVSFAWHCDMLGFLSPVSTVSTVTPGTTNPFWHAHTQKKETFAFLESHEANEPSNNCGLE